MSLIQIHFDGGCRPTNPGNCYGSFEVVLENKQVQKNSRFELGFGTNNDAEFLSLEKALTWTLENLAESGNSPASFDLEIISDSTIVVNRLMGNYHGTSKQKKSEPGQRMAKHAEVCLGKMIRFKTFKAQWKGRANNVTRFGH